MRPIRLEFTAFGSYPGRQVVDFDALGRRLYTTLTASGTGRTQVELRRRDGRGIYVDLQATRLENGEVLGFVTDQTPLQIGRAHV